MTDSVTPPTDAAGAQAMAAALATYTVGRLTALAAVIAGDDLQAMTTQLQGFASDQLPSCNTTKNLTNLLTCLNAIKMTAPQDVASLTPPPAPVTGF